MGCQSWTVSDTCVRYQPAPSLRRVHFRWESARSRVAEDLVALLERLIASGAYRPGPVPFRRPLFIDRHGVAYFHQYLPIDQLLPRRSPTEAAVARAEDEISRGLGVCLSSCALEAYGAGNVVAGRRDRGGNETPRIRRCAVLGAARPRVDQRSHVIVFGGSGRTEQLGSCRFGDVP